MQHYYGAKAICDRIDYKAPQRLPELIKTLGLPAYPRRRKGRLGVTYYASEAMITAWELSRAKLYREVLLGKCQLKAEGKLNFIALRLAS